MGISSKTSSSKLTNSSKAAPPTWREKLQELCINRTYDGRTCEVLLMAELLLNFSEVIYLFNSGAKGNPLSVIKTIDSGSLLMEIKSKGKGPIEQIQQAATLETKVALNTSITLPQELIANLIKLKIINMILEDVELRDEERTEELNKLAAAANQADGKKGMGKEMVDKKTKGKVVLPIEERKLYFVLNGFYDPDLIEELWKIEIPLYAILELALPESVLEELCIDPVVALSTTTQNSRSLNSINEELTDEELLLYVNKYFHGVSKDSVRLSMFVSEQTKAPCGSVLARQIAVLHNFWSKIYKLLEGELQAVFLEPTAHIRIFPTSALPHNEKSEENQADEVFYDIAKEVLKISHVILQYENYLKHVKVIEVKDKVKKKKTRANTLEKLCASVPLDCFSIAFFVHSLIEEVCARIEAKTVVIEADPNHSQLKLEESNLQCSGGSSNVGVLKMALADYLIRYKKKYARSSKTKLTYRNITNKYNTKINIEISRKFFNIHENNWLEFRMKTYRKLSSKLLKVNFYYLKKNPTTFLWSLFRRLKTMEIIYRNHQLEIWSRLLNLSVDELKDCVASIQFERLQCKKSISLSNKSSLQVSFPEKNYSTVIQIARPFVKYIETPEISLESLDEQQSYIKIPKLQYSNDPNVYQALNISTYLWYENLSPIVLLQQLHKANLNFICNDYKHCPYNDSIILRYHNDLDDFGINTKLWSQSLRTPVCFRDFCKYTIHEEAGWFEHHEVFDHHEELPSKSKTDLKPSSLKEKCSKSGEPYYFLAYDLSEARVQLTGSTTMFHSMDGYKVIVDRTNLIGKPSKLSLDLAIGEHHFIMHVSEQLKDTFMFHFCLADGTIIVFSKPSKKTDVAIAERVYKHNDDKLNVPVNSAYRPREKKVYFLSTTSCCHPRITKGPLVPHRKLIVPDYLLSTLLSNMGVNKSHKCSGQQNEVYEQKGTVKKNVGTLYSSPKMNHSVFIEESKDTIKIDLATSIPSIFEEGRDILHKIKQAKKQQIPMFKVYSSKLHKFEYIKRIKSHINIEIKKKSIRLLCKHPNYKITRYLEITKVLPIKLTNNTYCNNYIYDLKVSLPSGLILYTIPGANNEPFNIKQKYIEKGPQCKQLEDEESRTFLRNGNIVIKKSDGTLEVYSVEGQIIRCEIPYKRVQTQRKYTIRRRNGMSIESRMQRICHWRRKHIIDGIESRCDRYHRKFKKYHQAYMIKKEGHNDFTYTLLTHDGKQLRMTGSKVKKENQIFQTCHQYINYEEYLLLRDDGVISLLYGGGMLTTQFSDNTKISSWFSEVVLIIIDEEEEQEEEFPGRYEEWVFVTLFFKFEHPNYATILFNNELNEAEIFLQNDVILNVTEDGYYFLDIDGIITSVINQNMVYLETRFCDICRQRSISIVNVAPLCNPKGPIKDTTELLKTCDSYEKIFVVNYSGKCFRNCNYVNRRENRADCSQHDTEDYQKLFVLNRDLSGKMLWDAKAYRRRVVAATKNYNTVLQYYGKNESLEFRTHQFKPYHSYFMQRNYDVTNKISITDKRASSPALAAYSTFCHIHSMAKTSLVELLRSTVQEELHLANVDLSSQPPYKATLSPAMSLHDRWYSWLATQQTLPNDQTPCICKDDVNLMSLVSNSNSSDSSFKPYQKPRTAVCTCHVPADFVCTCAMNILDVEVPEEEEEREKIGFLTTDLEESWNMEGRRRISSIAGWSNEELPGSLYVYGEDAMSPGDLAKSVSDTAVHPPKPCSCRIKEHGSREKANPREETCRRETCERKHPKLSSSGDHELPERLAGGKDFSFSSFNLKQTEIAGNIQRRRILKNLQRKIYDLILVKDSNQMGVMHDIMKNILSRSVHEDQLVIVLNKLNGIVREKLSVKEISNLIYSILDDNHNGQYQNTKCINIIPLKHENLIKNCVNTKSNNKY